VSLSVAVGVAVLLAAAPEGLVRTIEGADVDWSAGTVSARGGSAADYRLPSADIARPGAERRARAAAASKLKAALAALPLAGTRKLSGADVDAAVGRARAAVEYQSNGGALVTLSLRFAEIFSPARPAETSQTFTVGAMPLELAPRLTAGEDESALAWAVYRTGAPPAGVTALALRRDRQGRLVVPRGETPQKLAAAPAVIYVQKILK
jgi:hypothetical protein